MCFNVNVAEGEDKVEDMKLHETEQHQSVTRGLIL